MLQPKPAITFGDSLPKPIGGDQKIPALDSLPNPAPLVKNVTPEVGQVSTELAIPSDMSVNFGFNSSDVPYYFYTNLDQAAKLLNNEPKLGVELRGYSDSVGNAEYNKVLSKTRSNQIKVNLTDRGVSEDQIVVKTFGASVSPHGRSANHRRVDIVFYER